MRQTRTAAPYKNLQKPRDPPQRCRKDPALRPGTSVSRHQPSCLYQNRYRVSRQLEQVQNQALEPGLCPRRQHRHIYYQTVEFFFFCIYVLVLVGPVYKVDQNSRTLVEMTPQWVDLDLASVSTATSCTIRSWRPDVSLGASTSPSAPPAFHHLYPRTRH